MDAREDVEQIKSPLKYLWRIFLFMMLLLAQNGNLVESSTDKDSHLNFSPAHIYVEFLTCLYWP
jgi:hypothetical protein